MSRIIDINERSDSLPDIASNAQRMARTLRSSIALFYRLCLPVADNGGGGGGVYKLFRMCVRGDNVALIRPALCAPPQYLLRRKCQAGIVGLSTWAVGRGRRARSA